VCNKGYCVCVCNKGLSVCIKATSVCAISAIVCVRVQSELRECVCNN